MNISRRNLPGSKTENYNAYNENMQNQIKQGSTTTSNVMILMVVTVMH